MHACIDRYGYGYVWMYVWLYVYICIYLCLYRIHTCITPFYVFIFLFIYVSICLAIKLIYIDMLKCREGKREIERQRKKETGREKSTIAKRATQYVKSHKLSCLYNEPWPHKHLAIRVRGQWDRNGENCIESQQLCEKGRLRFHVVWDVALLYF